MALIEHAALPDPAMYTDPVQFARQREVFARAWHPIDPAHIPQGPSRAVPFALLEGCLDEPLVLTRDAHHALRCMSNVCTHRAARVVNAPLRADSLRCRYHGRRFTLEGRFVHAPGFERACDFPRAQDDLPPVALEQVGPLWCASLEPAVPFAAWSSSLTDTLAFAMERPAVYDPSRDRAFELAAHWALYCENYLEGFHIPFVHPELAGSVEFSSYRVEPLEHGVLQTGFATTPDVACFELPPEHRDYGRRVAAYYLWLFPHVMVNVYPWGISLNVVVPLGPDRTRVLFRGYVWDASLAGHSAGGALDLVEQQDEAVVESVQQGVRARLYKPGRYAPAHEAGVHAFHALLARALHSPR